MATHSSVLAWSIPGQRSLAGCRLWGLTEWDATEATQQQQQQQPFTVGTLLCSTEHLPFPAPHLNPLPLPSHQY